MYFGGVEGGATHSKLVICDAGGDIVATIRGPSTNHWALGLAQCADRLADMLHAGKLAAGLDAARPLCSLGLSLSGCEQPTTNAALERELRSRHPLCADEYVVCSDTVGTVCTASPLGGLCLIAGTGSNALLRNPDGTTFTCGGWGQMLADEGSAWWIAHRAIKTLFDHEDGLVHCTLDVQAVWRCVREHFGVQQRADVLDHCYGKYEKCRFAGLCELLAAAGDDGDPLCRRLFAEAGAYLAKAAMALMPRVTAELVQPDGYLSVVCAGSVWKSWPLLRPGFVRELAGARNFAFGVRLVRLRQLMAIGAVYMAADAVGFALPRDYAANVEVFEEFDVVGGGINRDDSALHTST